MKDFIDIKFFLSTVGIIMAVVLLIIVLSAFFNSTKLFDSHGTIYKTNDQKSFLDDRYILPDRNVIDIGRARKTPLPDRSVELGPSHQ